MLRLALAAAVLAVVCRPAYAASVESLRFSGAGLHSTLRALSFSAAAGETERDRNLKLARGAGDRAYRVAADLAMLDRTAAEVRRELDALAGEPGDRARQDRVEWLLYFSLETFRPQGDALRDIMGVLLLVRFEPPEPEDKEFHAVIRKTDGRVVEADEAGKKLAAAVAANDAKAQGLEGLSERAQWLSARLAAYAAEYAAYSARVRAESRKLAEGLPPAG